MEEMHVQAVLFDRDGVLTYFDIPSATAFFQGVVPLSIYQIAARWQVFGTRMGFPRNMAEESQFFTEFWAGLSDEFNLTSDQRTALNNLDYTRFIVPYPEVRPVLEHLHAWNIRLGVLSNFSLASLDQSLLATGLANYFDVICAATVIGAAKPSARAFEIALNSLQVESDRCLFFDDEIDCVNGAQMLGIKAYLVDRHAAANDWQRGVVTNLLPVLQLVF
jgi:HAD superfamily hydrolase (TIGR01509 family)